MATTDQGTPGFNDGWFNGNPHKWIEAGTYEKFRDRLEGLKYSAADIEALDEAWAAQKKINEKRKAAQETAKAEKVKRTAAEDAVREEDKQEFAKRVEDKLKKAK